MGHEEYRFDLTRTIDAAMLHSNADYSVYKGWEVVGQPTTTIRRGEIVFANGQILGQPGSGEIVRRGPTQAL